MLASAHSPLSAKMYVTQKPLPPVNLIPRPHFPLLTDNLDFATMRGSAQICLIAIIVSSASVHGQSCNDYPCGSPGPLGFTPYTMCHQDSQMESCLPLPFIWEWFAGFHCGPCTGASGGGGGNDNQQWGGGGGGWNSGSFQITLQFEGVSKTDSSLFANAAKKWSSVIRSDVPDVVLAGSIAKATDCGSGLPGEVDDIHICSLFKSVDGVSGVLGFAGPRVIDVVNGVTRAVTGDMVFDSADMDNLRKKGTLEGVITHEMGHVLGIGTLWGDNGLKVNGCSYNKRSKVAETWYEYSGCSNTNAIMEQNGAAGTRCSHFSEYCFQNELMTGFLTGIEQPLSEFTLAGLEDLGYSVDYSKAEEFTSKSIKNECLCNRRKVRTLLDSGRDRGRPRRQLSEAGEKAASDFGRKVLNDRYSENSFRVAEGDITEHSVFERKLEDFGTRGLIVLYEEGDNIYSVDVYADR